MKFKTIEEFTDTLRSFSSSVKRGRWFLEDLCYSEFGEENCNKYLVITDKKGDDGIDAYIVLNESVNKTFYAIQAKSGEDITEKDIRSDLTNVLLHYKEANYEGTGIGIKALRENKDCTNFIFIYFTTHPLSTAAKNELLAVEQEFRNDPKLSTRFGESISIVPISKEDQFNLQAAKRRLDSIKFRIPSSGLVKVPNKNYYSGWITCKDLINLLSEAKESTGSLAVILSENIRSWLEWKTPVNKMIKETLATAPSEFVERNNGCNILAKNLQQSNVPGFIEFTGPSIANGGQTAMCIFHFILENMSLLGIKSIEEFFEKNIHNINDIHINFSVSDVTEKTESSISTIIKARNSTNAMKARDFASKSPYLSEIRNLLSLCNAKQIAGIRGKVLDCEVNSKELDQVKFLRTIEAVMDKNVGAAWNSSEEVIVSKLPHYAEIFIGAYNKYGEYFVRSFSELCNVACKNKKKLPKYNIYLGEFMINEIFYNIFKNIPEKRFPKKREDDYFKYLYSLFQDSHGLGVILELCEHAFISYSDPDMRDDENRTGVSFLMSDAYGDNVTDGKSIEKAIKQLNDRNSYHLKRLCRLTASRADYRNEIEAIFDKILQDTEKL